MQGRERARASRLLSTDFAAVCLTCRQEIHLGVRMALGPLVFGNGSDDEVGRAAVGWWIEQHVCPNDGATHDVRIFTDAPEALGEIERIDSAELEARFLAERPWWKPGLRSGAPCPKLAACHLPAGHDGLCAVRVPTVRLAKR